MSPLHWAALGGKIECVQALLTREEYEEFPEELDELFEPDSLNRSPLHLAAFKGHAEAMSALLAKGPADLMGRLDSEGRSVLHNAAMKVHAEVVDIIVADKKR